MDLIELVNITGSFEKGGIRVGWQNRFGGGSFSIRVGQREKEGRQWERSKTVA